jgi:hypothetical protein
VAVAMLKQWLLECGDKAALYHFSTHVASSSEYKVMNTFQLWSL